MIRGKPLNIWLGLVLLVLITIQVSTGLAVYRGVRGIVMYHRFNAIVLSSVVAVHAYYGVGSWFFGFRFEE